MFNDTKFIVCIYFSKYKVFCSLAQIYGNKVDITAFDEMKISHGVIEEGIVYDPEYLSQITKNLVASVSKSIKRIDSAWIVIPDNKIKIANIQVPKVNEQIDRYEMDKLLEDKFQYPPSQLYLLHKPIHDINNNIFLLSYAIKPEHLNPYLHSLKDLDINVESVFPSFECIYTELKNYFVVPTLILYPYHTGYKFFIADENAVFMNSIWGHSVVELNNNFNNAIEEIITFASRSKDVALDIKKILIIETKSENIELLQGYLRKINIEVGWIRSDDYKHYLIDEISLIILKGLLKNGARSTKPKGLLTETPKEQSEIDNSNIQNLIKRNLNGQTNKNLFSYNNQKSLQKNNNFGSNLIEIKAKKLNIEKVKTTLVSFLVTILLIGSIVYAGWKITEKLLNEEEILQKGQNITTDVKPTPTLVNTPTKDISENNLVTITPTSNIPTPSLTPTPQLFRKNEVRVLVLNGNNRTGEARLVTNILQTNGFLTKAPDNAPEKGIPTTSVKYRDKRAVQLSEEIAKLIEVRYPTAKAEYDPNIKEDIVVILGNN